MGGRPKTRTTGKDHDLLYALKRAFGTYKHAHVALNLDAKGVPQDEFYRLTRGYSTPENLETVRTAYYEYRVTVEHAFATDPTIDHRRLGMIGLHIRGRLRQHGIEPVRLKQLLVSGTPDECTAILRELWWLFDDTGPDVIAS